MIGRFVARALEDGYFGRTPTKGTEYVRVKFQIEDGEFAGKTVAWTGWLTEKATDRTLESLRACGARMANGDVFDLSGISTNPVEIVVEEKRSEKEPEKVFSQVAWVNALGVSPDQQLDSGAANDLRERCRARLIRLRTEGKTPPDNDIPF